jgi:hypothetical protein
MSFLSRLGLRAVCSVEPTCVINSQEDDNKNKTLKSSVFEHQKIPISFKEFCISYFFTNKEVYIDHESGMLPVSFSFDDEFDLVIEDYECPDCDDDGGCSHCEKPHLVDHECPVSTTGFINFVHILNLALLPDNYSFEGKLHFHSERWQINKNGVWIDISLPIDKSTNGDFLAEFIIAN